MTKEEWDKKVVVWERRSKRHITRKQWNKWGKELQIKWFEIGRKPIYILDNKNPWFVVNRKGFYLPNLDELTNFTNYYIALQLICFWTGTLQDKVDYYYEKVTKYLIAI